MVLSRRAKNGGNCFRTTHAAAAAAAAQSTPELETASCTYKDCGKSKETFPKQQLDRLVLYARSVVNV